MIVVTLRRRPPSPTRSRSPPASRGGSGGPRTWPQRSLRAQGSLRPSTTRASRDRNPLRRPLRQAALRIGRCLGKWGRFSPPILRSLPRHAGGGIRAQPRTPMPCNRAIDAGAAAACLRRACRRRIHARRSGAASLAGADAFRASFVRRNSRLDITVTRFRWQGRSCLRRRSGSGGESRRRATSPKTPRLSWLRSTTRRCPRSPRTAGRPSHRERRAPITPAPEQSPDRSSQQVLWRRRRRVRARSRPRQRPISSSIAAARIRSRGAARSRVYDAQRGPAHALVLDAARPRGARLPHDACCGSTKTSCAW